ncbi:MAG: phosphoenolpyruvate--protein phosphotransferase [Clostridia bacterium]|nr:phosphoenolpyruvate--protein phosphotransferase [Clostridia bacterium]
MKAYKGNRVFEGYALGRLAVYSAIKVEKAVGLGKEKEFERFCHAREETVQALDVSYAEALEKLGEKEAALFETHKLMAEDLDFEDAVNAELDGDVTAEFAVQSAGEQLAEIFASMDDAYMKERANDVREVASRIISFLKKDVKGFVLEEPSIIVCDDLPSNELMKIDRDLILGIVFVKGGTNSHVSILTRMLEIPSLCGVDGMVVDESLDGVYAILDANKGDMIFEPESQVVADYTARKRSYEEEKEKLQAFKGKPTLSRDGKKTEIYSNIASSFEVENALKNDSEGIGLFRSEFLYLESSDYPTEDEQFEHYKRVVEAMNPRQVIIRTLDIGADKKIDYFDLPDEENPALGFRSIRICQARPHIFLTQLKALYRASHYGNLAIMVPMIISLSEVDFIKRTAAQARDELRASGIPFKEDVKIGIMIETPSAAVLSDLFAEQVDFFSIGTNDLTQYTLALDRVNPNLKEQFDPRHRSVTRLIKTVADNAHKAGIPVGICGELARDEILLPFFVKIGIDELSVSPAYTLQLRKRISEIDTKDVDLKDFI